MSDYKLDQNAFKDIKNIELTIEGEEPMITSGTGTHWTILHTLKHFYEQNNCTCTIIDQDSKKYIIKKVISKKGGKDVYFNELKIEKAILQYYTGRPGEKDGAYDGVQYYGINHMLEHFLESAIGRNCELRLLTSSHNVALVSSMSRLYIVAFRC